VKIDAGRIEIENTHCAQMSKRAQPLLSKQMRLDLSKSDQSARAIMPQINRFPSIPTKILLPIDFSPSSQAALDMAADLAQHFQAELHLVNVIPEFPTTTIPDFIPEAEFLDNARKYAEVHLAKCKAALQTRGVKSTFSVEVGNDVVGNIMDVVDREHIDMIVISTHGISGWHPLVFGSIAEKVVKLAQCPLLLLHSAKPESEVKTTSGRLMEWW
jgi:nucleotide-binding universal stress UspA family protein